MRAPTLGIVLVLSTALISGVSIYVNSSALQAIPPSLLAGMKNALVAIAFVAVLLATREARTLRTLPRGDWLRLAAIGLIGGAIPFLLFFNGLARMAAPTASFLHKTMFLEVAVFATVFLKDRIDWRLFAAAGLLLAGMAALTPVFRGSPMGFALVLLAVVFWAGEIMLSKATLRRLGPNLVIFGRMGFGSAFLLVYLTATGEAADIPRFTGEQWSWLLVTAAFLMGYVGTFYHGLKRIDATSTTSLLTVGAVVTAVIGVAVLSRPVTLVQAGGAVLVVLGTVAAILYVIRSADRRKEADEIVIPAA